MGNREFECQRCGQAASPTALRRGHCTACGAMLGSAVGPKEAYVRAFLSHLRPPQPAVPSRGYTARAETA